MRAIIEDAGGNVTVIVGPIEAVQALVDRAENNGGRLVKPPDPDWKEQVQERQKQVA